jgi:hypothetical protein
MQPPRLIWIDIVSCSLPLVSRFQDNQVHFRTHHLAVRLWPRLMSSAGSCVLIWQRMMFSSIGFYCFFIVGVWEPVR